MWIIRQDMVSGENDIRNDLFPVTIRLELIMEFATEISIQVGRRYKLVKIWIESHLVSYTIGIRCHSLQEDKDIEPYPGLSDPGKVRFLYRRN
jgi:hypothetical protein